MRNAITMGILELLLAMVVVTAHTSVFVPDPESRETFVSLDLALCSGALRRVFSALSRLA